jgi:hypothetical protein
MRVRGRPDRALRVALGVYVAAVALHAADHLHRGMWATPPSVAMAGRIQFVAIAVLIVLVWMRHRRAPEAAMLVGFASAALFTYAHVLPRWWDVLSDSFLSPDHQGVTWFSWLTAVAEISAGLALGATGIRSRQLGRVSHIWG